MKLYGIIKECFFHHNMKKPEIHAVPKLFESKEAAQYHCERLCAGECTELNVGRKSKDFRWDEDGSEHYDYVVRFWDGDDYTPVTGYIISEFEH